MIMSAFPLSAYADALRPLTVSCSGDFSVPVGGITNDSRRAAPGVLFCAIRGAKADGHRFLPDAVRAGICGAVIAADSDWTAPDPAFPVLRVRDSYYAWALLCETFYGRPASGMDVFAVTGTNGKTTIAFLLRRLFRAAFPGENCGLLSTVEYDTGSGSEAEEASRTTPDISRSRRLASRQFAAHARTSSTSACATYTVLVFPDTLSVSCHLSAPPLATRHREPSTTGARHSLASLLAAAR